MREVSESNANLREQLRRVGVDHNTDGDAAVIINMHQSDPKLRAQSEWLAREQRKLARAKEQYARDIRELQRKAESSLAKAERNLHLRNGAPAITNGDHHELLHEMRKWEADVIAAVKVFMPTSQTTSGDDRSLRAAVVEQLRGFRSAQRYVCL